MENEVNYLFPIERVVFGELSWVVKEEYPLKAKFQLKECCQWLFPVYLLFRNKIEVKLMFNEFLVIGLIK